MSASLVRIPPEYRQELAQWLDEAFTFDLFVTLTTHSPGLGRDRLRDLAREWDARMNRRLYGPKWQKHADELLWTFAFLEKPVNNPHWHLLIRQIGPDDVWKAKVKKIDDHAEEIWQKIMPGGGVDVRKVTHTQDKLIDYVAKELGHKIQYEDFITPDEFRRF